MYLSDFVTPQWYAGATTGGALGQSNLTNANLDDAHSLDIADSGLPKDATEFEDLDGAKQEALAKAISLETSSTGPFIQMGKVLLRRNDPQTSLLYLQHAEKMDPGNYMTHTLLGQAYRSLGRDEEAKKEIDMASKIHAERQTKSQPALESQ